MTLSHGYTGPDGTVGDADDKVPLVLVGTWDNPIDLKGPFVVPGDVIIKGVVTGRGTIYSGRNIHVAGEITYKKPPTWPVLTREGESGIVRDYQTQTALGTVCADGAYVKPGQPTPQGCI